MSEPAVPASVALPRQPPRRLKLPQFPSRATYVLIVINAVVFLLDMLSDNLITIYGALVPILLTAYGQWWRLIAAGFLHADLIHIAMNLYALYGLGRLMERFFGLKRFLAVYGLSLLGSSTLVTLFSDAKTPTVGASGAIMGILGALLIYFWKYRDLLVGARGFLGQLGRMALINIGIGLLPGISWWGHLGGFLAGVGAGAALLPRYTHPGWAAEHLELRELNGRARLGIAAVAATELGLLALAFWWRN
jgi:membrane associated rhomboid family serine protease